MSALNVVAEAFEEIGRVVRVFSVGGRRVERFMQEQRYHWVQPSFGMNRRARKGYIVQLRKSAAEARKEKEQFVRYVLSLERVR